MNSLVTIIIPCYNHGHYLVDALDSVLAQTHFAWEAIVVDDGSTDNTLEVAQRYAAYDGRILYLHQSNSGLAAARNAGIRVANGEFLAFLDADDAWEPTFLSVCICRLRARPMLSGVYTLSIMVDDQGQELPARLGQARGPSETRQRLFRGGSFPPCAVVVRAVEAHTAGLFDESLEGRGTEDWDLWLRITAQGAMAGIPLPLARYRAVSGSMSTDVEAMHRNRIAVLSKHLGSPDGTPSTWPTEKRDAYGWVFQAAAVQYITQGQVSEGWNKLDQAAAIWPGILLQPETHYELACWDQPRGYRGQAQTLDLGRNAPLVLAGLEQLFAEGGEDLRCVRSGALGQAYLAFAMLADQAGRWRLARGYLLRAMSADPRLLGQNSTVRRLAKLAAGRRLVTLMAALLREATS